jgi:hypothetical protein
MTARNPPYIDKLTLGHVSLGIRQMSQLGKPPTRLRQRIRALGPTPRISLEVLVDLGLSDVEIARYFDVSQTCIVSLRKIWGIRRQG